MKKQRLRHKVLVVFIRPYRKNDIEQIIAVYKSAFAEPPWDEFKKCSACEVEYGIKESERAGNACKKCDSPLELVDFWSSEEIIQDLEFALSQPNQLVLVAENSNGIAGFTWGYRLPFEKFPFLEGKINPSTLYIDEIAVRGDKRLRGVGTRLGQAFLESAKAQSLEEATLRTDERNPASIALFRKLGFREMRIYDPEFPSRVYMRVIV
ncbi:GNAT family N-acetyltransferase [Candidatus Woesearchaeota archaeon]|nr:GNAT family N-acetyltransferase [Candidatus Woesearchaeota archaeon]MBW3006286.1 GNAT family N-acetyltransferase [Candidatus Woesearchaeota archaeon]